MDGHPGWTFFCDLNLHNRCCYKAGRPDHSGNEQLLLNLVPYRPLALVVLKNGSCARSSALKCAEQVSRVVGKWLIVLEVWVFVLCGGSHRILWRTLESLGGAGGCTGERSWEKSHLRTSRHKSAFKKCLVEGAWQILEHQQCLRPA